LRPPLSLEQPTALNDSGSATSDEPALSRVNGASARQLLERCKERLARLQTTEPLAVYHERLITEINVIDAAGMSAYFLLVADVVAHARSAGIALMARGSAVSSLVV